MEEFFSNPTNHFRTMARKFNDEQEQEICARYLLGESGAEISRSFGCLRSTINRILRRNDMGARSSRSFTDEKELEIVARICKGETKTQIAESFGCGSSLISKVAIRHGLESRGCRKLSGEREGEICRRYLAGETTVELSAAFGLTSTSIGRLLRRNSTELRTTKECNGGLDESQEKEVCRRYSASESCEQLGEAFDVTATTIHRILRREGIQTRSVKEANGGLTEAQESEACLLYLSGKSTYEVGRDLGVSATTVGVIVKRHGMEVRAAEGFGDSVQSALDCTGRHDRARECEFYLYTLARYAQTHCKPGISFDADLRVDEEYGEAVLRLLFSTRQEPFFLEQAVLDVTRGPGQCPDDLTGWAGASEIRAMSTEDMLPIVLRLADEMEELGVWEFAVRYVPMTAAQRAICQQRAAACAPAFAA